ncbi:MAG: polysaccharide biosynthesis C-terminal domain-containing protein [Planctomycetes bacterium]|nr:polysaccharide biosynthesis C-terminal domain-containing protein [Planctomycetota bacterium]
MTVAPALAHVRSSPGEGIALGAAARAGGLALGLLTAIVLARGLGVEGRGAFALCVLYAELTATLSSLGIHEAVAFHTARGTFPPEASLGSGTALALGTSLVGALLAAALIASGVLTLPPEGAALALAALLAVPALRLHHVLGAFLRGRGEFREFNLLQVSRPIATLGLALLFVGALGLGVAGALLGFVLAALLPAVLGLLQTRRGLAAPTFRRDAAAAMLRFGSRAWPGTLAVVASRRLDFLLLSWFAASADLGRYAVATQVAEVLLYFPAAAAMVLLPLVARGPRGLTVEARSWLARSGAIHLGLCGVAALAGILLARPVLASVFGHGFEGAAAPLLWLLPGVACAGLSLLLGAALSGAGKPGSNAIAAAIGALVAVPIYLLLVPSHGIVGAAIGSSLAYAIQAAAQAVFLARRDVSRRS